MGEWSAVDFSEYQKEATRTVSYPKSQAVYYPVLGLVGEAGEVANKLKKVLRGDEGACLSDIGPELGDVLWYIAAIATDLNIKLEDIAELNLQKLRDRHERGVIKGSGDDR